MAYGVGWGSSPWGGSFSATEVEPVLYDIEIDETPIVLTSDIFIGVHQIPTFLVGAQSPTKVEVVFSVAMSIDSNFVNPARYTLRATEAGTVIPITSVTVSGTAPLRRATLRLGTPLESKEYYSLVVADSILSLTGDPSDPDIYIFQWSDMTTPVFVAPLEIPIRDFSGEVTGGLLGNPDGQVFFTPAYETVGGDSTIELESVSVCTRAYDEYHIPDPPDPAPLLTWRPGITTVIGAGSVLWAPADRLGLPSINLTLLPEDVFQPANDFAVEAELVEPIDITKAGFLNDARWKTFPATGATVFRTASNLTFIGPGPTTPVTLDWPKIVLDDNFPITDQVVVNILDVETATDNVDVVDSLTVQNITIGTILITIDEAVSIADSTVPSTQYSKVLATDPIAILDTIARDKDISRTLSDTILVTDDVIIVAGVVYDVVGSDTITVTEQMLLSLVYSLTVSDTVTSTDSNVLSLEYNKTLADAVTIADTADAVLQGDLILDDSIVVADSTVIQPYSFYSLSLSDDISVTDAQTLDFYVSSSDNITITVAVIVGREVDRNAADTLAITDVVSLNLEYGRSIDDTADLTDTVAALLVSAVDVVVDDTLTITDANSIQVDKGIFDSIGITDSLSLEMQVNLTLSDTPVITDSVALSSEYAVSGSDTIVTPDFVVAGAPMKYHTTSFSPVALWQLNGNLNDSSGNGFTLTLESGGTARYLNNGPGAGDLKGFLFDGVTRLVYNTTGSSLQITGDVTIEMIITLASYSANSVLFSYGGNNTTEATNLLYNLALATTDGVGLTWSSEHGSAVLDTYTSTLASIPLGVPCHFAVTRTSDVIQFYLNGQAIGAASSALTTPTGGTSSVFHLGGEVGTGTNFVPKYSSIASVKVIASALSSAQVLSEYQATLGQYYG